MHLTTMPLHKQQNRGKKFPRNAFVAFIFISTQKLFFPYRVNMHEAGQIWNTINNKVSPQDCALVLTYLEHKHLPVMWRADSCVLSHTYFHPI